VIGLRALSAAAVLTASALGGSAHATPPPADPRDEAVHDALEDVRFMIGYWEGQETGWPNARESLAGVSDGQAIYLRLNAPSGDASVPVLTLIYDSKARAYRLMSPVSGGYDLAEVAHPSPNTLTWVTHPDGPAIRTTFIFADGALTETRELLDVDGVTKPLSTVVMRWVGPARLTLGPASN
jgi:hypothetical protein